MLNKKKKEKEKRKERDGNQNLLAQKELTLSNNQKEEGTKNYPDLKQNNGYIFEKEEQGL